MYVCGCFILPPELRRTFRNAIRQYSDAEGTVEWLSNWFLNRVCHCIVSHKSIFKTDLEITSKIETDTVIWTWRVLHFHLNFSTLVLLIIDQESLNIKKRQNKQKLTDLSKWYTKWWFLCWFRLLFSVMTWTTRT